MTLPTVRLFLLGGTITMEKARGGGVVPTMDAATLCRAVPGLDRVATVEPRTDQMVASGNLTYEHAIDLAAKITQAAVSGAADGFVIVQGTDTLEEMAFILDCLLDIDRPVVVTGAMRNPTSLSADGPANILAAVTCAATKKVARAGVVVVLNDEIHVARFVTKTHSGSVGTFQSPNMGPVGRVTEGKVSLFSLPVVGPKVTLPDPGITPKIALIKTSLGDEGHLLELINQSDFQGLVIEGFGAGHVPESYLDSLDKILPKMPVILASRTQAGHVLRQTYGFAGSEIDLIRRGLVPSGILDGLKAKSLLTLLLMSGASQAEITTAFAAWDLT
ncbi:MAG: L-asparaginase [Alphaproteobacteria bacterium]|nr:MAG: L-asparaginase [Alphaproteobacteria bacterium]